MGKLKEYYHDEINRGIEGEDKEFALTCMSNVSRIYAKYNAGQITVGEFVAAIDKEVTHFDYMHTPCQPK